MGRWLFACVLVEGWKQGTKSKSFNDYAEGQSLLKQEHFSSQSSALKGS